jgi:hypothetical protein
MVGKICCSLQADEIGRPVQVIVMTAHALPGETKCTRPTAGWRHRQVF